ncbi:MAG: Rieske 2Fe-2S domain-containing protein [Proteobacteria bacterium]|nr:Rieske 2Fe-2S domain-containing protein [Pseudomonadota bacterium]
MKILHQYKRFLETEKPDSAHSLPAIFYCDSEFHEIDKNAVLYRSWQLLGHISQLANTGDQVIGHIGDKPVLLVKTANNSIKAYYNVCRHRGGPLALENGNSKTLRCKYHGWNYSLDGQLKSAPEMQSTPGFDVCQYKLVQIKCDNWQGFIYVSFDEAVPPLDQLMKGIKDTVKPVDLSFMRFHRRDEFIIDCNWKVYVENYLEGYHLPHVHPGLNRLLDYRSYQTKLHQWHSYQFSPLDNGGGFYGDGMAHYYFVYPNTMFNILPNRLQTNQVMPMANNKSKVIFDYYYPDSKNPEIQQLIEQDREFSDEVQYEDIAICEAVQKGLTSGSYETGRLCMKRETALLHFQELIRKAYKNHLQQK